MESVQNPGKYLSSQSLSSLHKLIIFLLHAYMLSLLLSMQKVAVPELPSLHHATSSHSGD